MSERETNDAQDQPWLEANHLSTIWWALWHLLPTPDNRNICGPLSGGICWSKGLAAAPLGVSVWPADQTVEFLWNFGPFRVWYLRW